LHRFWYGERIEQYAKADLLAVTLFGEQQFVTNQKGAPAGGGGLAPPLYVFTDYQITIPNF
jgi:hypothetical protein